MRTHLTLASLLAVTLFGLAPRAAHAQSTCSADSDCVKGWTCQVSGGSACASPACPPGEKCEEQASDCTPVEYKSCQPGACKADSDCASGMVCYTYTESDCPQTACAPGQECPTPACEPKTESACVPRYVLPCTTASDCGAGFQCESAGDLCACSGSAGGTPTPDGASGGAAPVPTPPESCTCEPSKEMRCHAATVTCNADSDCTAGWSCAAVGSTSDCAGPATPEPNPGSGAGGRGLPTPAPPDCAPSVQAKQCVPPYYALVEGAKGAERGVGQDSSGPTLATGDATSGSAAAVPHTAESGKDDPTASAGCSVGHGSRTSSTFALLGALGLFGALRRRRAR